MTDPANMCAAAAARPAGGAAPSILGRYQLGYELASGGMATVYLALPIDSSFITRPLALKRIHPHLAEEAEFIAMFVDEARIAARLNHPNLCGVLDFGEADGSYFMTMEYLVGEPLSGLHKALAGRAERLSPRSRARVMAQIVADGAEGLHAAHEMRGDEGQPMNVVHRDVSPSNLFVTYDGVTKVVDFGIASAADRLHHTATGSIKGKFGYMPPEQLRGEKVGRAADIWALGVVLWEGLSGRRLFRRENPSLTVIATLEGRVPPLAEVARGLDPGLCAIAHRALAYDRAERFPTALALAEELQRFLARTGAPSARGEVSATIRAAFPHGEAEKRTLLKAVVEKRRTIEGVRQNDSHPSLTGTSPSRTGIVRKDKARAAPAALLARGLTAPWRATLAVGLGATLFAAGGAMMALSGSSSWAHLPAAGTSALSAGGARTEPSPAPAAPAAPSVRDEATARPTPAGHSEGPTEARAQAGPPPAWETAAPATRAPAGDAEGPTPDAPPATRPLDRRSAARAPAPRRSGEVSVFTVGDWARVYHGGRLLGTTPGRFSLPAGRQVLSVRPGSGGRARPVAVQVPPDATVRVRVELGQ